MVTLKELIYRIKKASHYVQHNKLHHRKVLLSSFHSQIQKLGPHPIYESAVWKARFNIL